MHRFTVGDYLLQITKERILLIFKEKDVTDQGEKWLNWLTTLYLGGLAQILGSYFRDMQ